MVKLAVLSLLVLFPQDPAPQGLSPAAIDSAVKSIPGWNPNTTAPRSDDVEFIHRVWTDLLGRKPGDEEVRAFTADPDPKKREKKIDQLVAAPEFGPFWGRWLAESFLGDLSKVRMERIEGVTPAAAGKIVDRFAEWLGGQVAKDRPFPDIVREMIEARGKSDDTPALGYKLAHFRGDGYPQEFAMGLSRGLLGVRLYCAKCHDHPYDRWTVENFFGLGAFVVREKASRVGFTDSVELSVGASGELMIGREPGANDKDSKVKLAQGGTAVPVFLFGGAAKEGEDRSKALASFVTSQANTQLPRALANRVWARLFRRGVVHPEDDFNLRNKAISPALMDTLVRGFLGGNASLKRFLEILCRSETYQLSDSKGPSGEDMVYLRGFRRTWPTRALPKDLPKFTPPEAWLPYAGPDRSPRPVYRIPDKEKTGGDAYFYRPFDAGEGILNQMAPAKAKTETVQGKQTVTLTEVKGTYPCDRIAGAPLGNYHILIARVGNTSRGLLRLEGPADTVADWRDAFVEILKGLDP